MSRRERREDALTTALSVTDTSRRVGWAKYFSSVEQADELSHDLNVAKSDFDLMSRFAGYLYGALGVAAPSIIAKLPSALDRLGVLSMLPDASIDTGRRVARKPSHGVGRGLLAKSGMSDREMAHFASEILRDRKKRQHAPHESGALVGKSIDISSVSQEKALTITSRTDRGVLLTRGRSRVYVDPEEIDRLIDVLKTAHAVV